MDIGNKDLYLTYDAFSRLRVSESSTTSDAQNVITFDTERVYDVVIYDSATPVTSTGSLNETVTGAQGSTVSGLDVDSRLVSLTLSDTYDNAKVIVQEKQYLTYTPGKSTIVFMTGVFSPGQSKETQEPSIVLRSSATGSTVDTVIPQSQWNINKMDGSGSFGIDLDFTKIQILWFDAQQLYSGRVRVGFDVDGVLYEAANFKIANNQSVPTLQTYNLPPRYEISKNSATSKAEARVGYFDKYNGVFFNVNDDFTGGLASIKMKCWTVQTEGGTDKDGEEVSAPMLASKNVSNGVWTPLLSIRMKEELNGFPNRSYLSPIDFSAINSSNNPIVVGLWYNATPSTPSWGNNVDDPTGTSTTGFHSFQVDTASTTMTGGHLVAVSLIPPSAGQSESVSQSSVTSRRSLCISKVDDLMISNGSLILAAYGIGAASVSCANINFSEFLQ